MAGILFHFHLQISEKMGKVAVKKAVIDYLEFSPNHEIDMSDEGESLCQHVFELNSH